MLKSIWTLVVSKGAHWQFREITPCKRLCFNWTVPSTRLWLLSIHLLPLQLPFCKGMAFVRLEWGTLSSFCALLCITDFVEWTHHDQVKINQERLVTLIWEGTQTTTRPTLLSNQPGGMRVLPHPHSTGSVLLSFENMAYFYCMFSDF